MNKSIFPNAFTGANLAFGVLGISLSATGNFTCAAYCILLALVMDGCDGRVARALGVSGPFGRELDSLADVVSFGVSPAFMLYSAFLSHEGLMGYVALVAFSVFGAFRLARFNIMTNEIKGFFQGLPIPAAGCLSATYVLSGMVIPTWALSLAMIIVGYLMVSQVHYPDFKGHAADKTNMLALAIVAVVAVGLFIMAADWKVVIVLPFLLYVVFGLSNTAINTMKH